MLLYKKTIEFLNIIPQFAILTSSRSFCTYLIFLDRLNKNSLISFFPICMPFNYFSCVRTLAGISNDMFDRSDQTCLPCA